MNAGEGDVTKLSNAIANCDGTAENMAATMQDNLAGQLTILKSQLEELAISFRELLMSAVRMIVGWLQNFVNWLNVQNGGMISIPVYLGTTLLDEVEADSSGETEAGMKQRDVVRLGVHTISVSFSVTPKWLKKLTVYKQKAKIVVKFFDTETLEVKMAEMYITGYKAKLEKDTSYKGLWTVSFTLNEF